MREIEVRDASTGQVIFPAAVEAVWPWERMRGLLGRKGLPEGFAMAFRRCPQVHCFGMSIPIDVVSLAASGKVLDVTCVEPGHIGPKVEGCKTVVECAAGAAEAAGVRRGSYLALAGR